MQNRLKFGVSSKLQNLKPICTFLTKYRDWNFAISCKKISHLKWKKIIKYVMNWAFITHTIKKTIYMHFLYELWYMTYILIQQQCHSVLLKLHPITLYETVILKDCAVPGLNATFCFLWFTNCALLSDDNSFCPWTFFQNIGFNMVPPNSFMSHLATQLGYIVGHRRNDEEKIYKSFT